MAFDRQELVVAAVLIGIVALAVVSNKKENVKADGGDADVDEREAVRQDFEDQIAGNKQRRVEWMVAAEDFLQRAQSSRAPPTGSRLDKELTGLLQGAVDITNDLQTILDAYHRVFSKSSHYIEIGDEITRETSEFLTLEHLLVELEKRWISNRNKYQEAGHRNLLGSARKLVPRMYLPRKPLNRTCTPTAPPPRFSSTLIRSHPPCPPYRPRTNRCG